MRYICTAVVATLALVGTSFAATINVPGDHATIQGAINASSNGDVIAIAAGTYYEHALNPKGKAITIGSASGNLDVTIDAQKGGSVFVFQSGEGPGTMIRNLRMIGGTGTQGAWGLVGGGIYFDGSNPTISSCTIEENTAVHGGGIFCEEYSNPTLTDCTIKNNTADSYGGGIFCNNSNPTISGCTIKSNAAYQGGGFSCYISSPIISGCTISNNWAYGYGGGVNMQDSNPTITQCTIEGNTAEYGGGGINCASPGTTPTIAGSSVCGNSPNQINSITDDDIETIMCWVAASCDGNPYITIANQQEQIEQLLTMHDQQQSAIEELQQVIEACCVERTCTGDENKDGVVNIEDLLIVISVWGPCP